MGTTKELLFSGFGCGISDFLFQAFIFPEDHTVWHIELHSNKHWWCFNSATLWNQPLLHNVPFGFFNRMPTIHYNLCSAIYTHVSRVRPLCCKYYICEEVANNLYLSYSDSAALTLCLFARHTVLLHHHCVIPRSFTCEYFALCHQIITLHNPQQLKTTQSLF